MITVSPPSAPCSIPDDPAPITLGAKPLAVGSWTSGASVVVSDGGAYVRHQALVDLGLYLVAARAVIQAQRDCLAARAAGSRPAP